MFDMTVFLKRIATVIFGVFLMAGLSGCNTVEGVGRDVESVGDGIEDAAD
ncbi:MAG: entericidin A/B family lipoprotein [Rhodospirillaceae bacterium]